MIASVTAYQRSGRVCRWDGCIDGTASCIKWGGRGGGCASKKYNMVTSIKTDVLASILNQLEEAETLSPFLSIILMVLPLLRQNPGPVFQLDKTVNTQTMCL